jgi:hypothetical protein
MNVSIQIHRMTIRVLQKSIGVTADLPQEIESEDPERRS